MSDHAELVIELDMPDAALVEYSARITHQELWLKLMRRAKEMNAAGKTDDAQLLAHAAACIDSDNTVIKSYARLIRQPESQR